MTLARDSVSDDLRTVVDLFRMRARLQPEFVGYRFLPDGDSRALELTYAELDAQARAIAARLQSRVPRGGRALLQIQSDLNFIVAFAGCLYAGVIPVPTMVPHRNRPIDGLCAIAEDCEPDIILTTSSILAGMNPALTTAPALQGRPWLAVDAMDGEFRRVARTCRSRRRRSRSFSTRRAPPARRKGVMVSHANILHNERMIRDACGHSERTVVVGWLPFFHDMGLIGNILQPLYLGAPCTLMPPAHGAAAAAALAAGHLALSRDDKRRSELRVRSLRHAGSNPSRPHRSISPPGSSRSTAPSRFSVRRSSASRGRSLRAAFAPRPFTRATGSPKRRCASATARRKPRRSSLDVDADALEQNRAVPANGAAAVRHLVGCGSASEFHDVQTVIVDPATRRRMPDGAVGEIWIKGPNVAQGYWRNQQATAKTFQAAARQRRRTVSAHRRSRLRA